jgi:drug/metabolite transporter (DMT)-like permease
MVDPVNMNAPRLPLLALLLANVALAFGPWLVRLAEEQSRVGPVASAFWRLALALPLLLLASLADGGRCAWRPSVPLGLALVGGLLFAGDLAAWHLSILATRLANATLLGNNAAILFPAYGFLMARARPSGRQGLALTLAFAGAMLLLGRSLNLSVDHLKGDLLAIVAGLFYTAYLIAVDRARRLLGPVTTLAAATLVSAIVLFGACLAGGQPWWPAAWAPLVLLAIGSQVVGQGLLIFAVGRVPPLAIGVALLLQPLVAAGIGLWRYGERPGLADVAGAIAIGAAILLVRQAPRLAPATEGPKQRVHAG